MNKTYDWKENLTRRFSGDFSRPEYILRNNPLTATTPIILWKIHYDRGWYHYLIEQEVEKAKQEFYVCGLLDEAVNKMVGHKTIRENGQNNDNSNSLDTMDHFAAALCADNDALIKRRIELTYPEHEQYVFQNKVADPIIMDLFFSLFKRDTKRVEEMNTLLASCDKPEYSVFDRLFIEGLLEGNPTKMQEGIEGVASPKIHKRRQVQNPNNLFFSWDNIVLSHSGIMYTKIAWMFGYELDIQAPLVRVAKDLWPVKPLTEYNPVYEFLQREN